MFLSPGTCRCLKPKQERTKLTIPVENSTSKVGFGLARTRVAISVVLDMVFPPPSHNHPSDNISPKAH